MGYRPEQKILNRGISNIWETFKEVFNILGHQENANQNDSKIPSYTFQSGLDKKHKWELMQVRLWSKYTPPLLVEMLICTATLEINMMHFQIIENPWLEHRGALPAESPNTRKGPHRIPHGILRPLVSGTQLVPGGRFEHQISGHLPCKKRACLQRILWPLKLRRELASHVCL